MIDAASAFDAARSLVRQGRVVGAEALIGDEAGRAERADAIRRVLAAHDRQGRTADAVHAAQGLAPALGDAGRTEEGFPAYAAAHERAVRLGRPEPISQTPRDWGPALQDAGRFEGAEARLDEAVRVAATGTDAELLGRGRIALGLFLQHRDRIGDARAARNRSSRTPGTA